MKVADLLRQNFNYDEIKSKAKADLVERVSSNFVSINSSSSIYFTKCPSNPNPNAFGLNMYEAIDALRAEGFVVEENINYYGVYFINIRL